MNLGQCCWYTWFGHDSPTLLFPGCRTAIDLCESNNEHSRNPEIGPNRYRNGGNWFVVVLEWRQNIPSLPWVIRRGWRSLFDDRKCSLTMALELRPLRVNPYRIQIALTLTTECAGFDCRVFFVPALDWRLKAGLLISRISQSKPLFPFCYWLWPSIVTGIQSNTIWG